MPCSQRKARLLLKQKKAKIVGYKPFTIQLCYATGEAKQAIIIGVDEGARHVGIAIVSQGWISGFSGTSSAYITDGNDQYIHMPGKTYKQVTLSKGVRRVCHNNIWRYTIHK